MTERFSPNKTSAAGFTLIELMVGLVICVTLLTAAGAAFVSASSAVQHNDQFARATQAARVSLNQILTEVRRADSVAVYSDRVEVIRPAQARTPNEAVRAFRYDSATAKLYLKITYSNGAAPQEHPMSDNVSAASFGPAENGTDSTGTAVVIRVPVSLTVAYGVNSVRFSGSAAPRRALQ